MKIITHTIPDNTIEEHELYDFLTNNPMACIFIEKDDGIEFHNLYILSEPPIVAYNIEYLRLAITKCGEETFRTHSFINNAPVAKTVLISRVEAAIRDKRAAICFESIIEAMEEIPKLLNDYKKHKKF